MLLQVVPSPSSAAPLPLKRGVGLHEWLNWSPLKKDGSYRWPPYRSVGEWLSGGRPLADWPKGDPFQKIRLLGFDFVRLTVDPGPLLDSNGPRRQQALKLLSDAVERLTRAGLKVVFNLHGVSQVPAYDMTILYGGANSQGVFRYRAMVKDVAAMLVKHGADKVAFEPYNEPAYYPCDANGTDDWQRIMAATVADIRSINRALTIVVTGACGGSITGLTNLDPKFDDENVYYSFHMYEPHSFTHQKADWENGFFSGFPWPAKTGTPANVIEGLRAHMLAEGLSPLQQEANITRLKPEIDDYFKEDWSAATMQARIEEAVTWADRHGIAPHRLFMGEFGVMRMSTDGRSGAYDADRLSYLQTLRSIAEKQGIPWSVWEYSNPYGMSVIEPKGPAVPDQRMLEALGLSAPQ
ncbi:cellulase family glycosylhydrolase [Rhizobium oryzicola]|uniref:Cellulase family glycosylhydrolase n=1 Tax=Rhizobium oryzicola TaxID=1232668 RepID=A0ABT8SWS3_9HYPH|nr:cellulase family glycosylhydrolase [Rhizobium oryzicola]